MNSIQRNGRLMSVCQEDYDYSFKVLKLLKIFERDF